MFVPAQWPDPGDGATITPGPPAFGEFCLNWAHRAPSLSFAPAAVEPKHWQKLSIAMIVGH